MGLRTPSLLLEIISSAEWGSKIEPHCSDEIGEGFDQQLMSAMEKTDTDFELIKHVGTELEMSDAVMEYANCRTPLTLCLFLRHPLMRRC